LFTSLLSARTSIVSDLHDADVQSVEARRPSIIRAAGAVVKDRNDEAENRLTTEIHTDSYSPFPVRKKETTEQLRAESFIWTPLLLHVISID